MAVNIFQFRIVMLWTLLLVGMVLHFNYHVSKVFYVASVVRDGADGSLPAMVFILRNVFYHLPIAFIVLALYGQKQWIRLLLFGISLPYSIAHLMHMVEELNKPVIDWWGQVILLNMLFVLSIILNITSWHYWKKSKLS